MRARGAAKRAAETARQTNLDAVAKAFTGFRPAHEAFTEVRAVPTCFIDFDRATRVGGLPSERITLMHGPSGHGKALHVDTPTLTPRGWMRIGDAKLGDLVIAPDGTATEITGVFPQGKKPLYRVTFDDGCFVECCDEHLWFTTTIKERGRGRYVRGPRPQRARIPTGVDGAGSVKSLAEIRDGFRPREHAIPIVAPVEFELAGDLPLDPYLLGLYLGDGSSPGQVLFHKPEQDLRAEFVSRLPGDDDAREVDDITIAVRGGALRAVLKELDLYGKRSWEKSIPSLYMQASIEDRLALLRGLVDTDGSVVKDGGAVEYSSSSFRLGDQVAELARSLGAYVIREERQTSFTYKGEKKKGRPSLRIRIYFNDDTIPCSSEKHLAKWRGRGGRRQFRTMVSIEPSRVAEAVCIAVAHPTRQFVTKDFIVTHNTYKALGLMKSFLVLENPTLFIDAERSTPKGFARIALDEMLKSPIFFYHRPTTYEATVSEVRRFCNIVKGLREKKKLHPDSVGLVVVDSIRKLVPAQQWEKILKLQAADAKADNVRDRAAQIKALMNAAWCDELIPLLEQTGCTMVIIARETDDAEAASKMTARQKMFSRSMPYKTGGGSALYYDASLDVRVELEGYVMKERAEGEQGPGVVYGERHRVTIKKSKVSGKVDKVITCFFHTSNGKLVPEGFDRARDVLEVGKNLGVVKINSKAAKPPPSSWLMWRGMRWHGDHLAVKKLTDSPELLADLEREVRAKFRSEAA